jgi:DNA-binding winged helix-turn-helix (wHTH) protein
VSAASLARRAERFAGACEAPAAGAVVYRFGECELDARRLELRRGGARVALQPKPLELLFYLARNRERAVSKQELLDALWPGLAVTENSLTRVVSLARLAIGDREGTPALLRTLPRVGYRFEAPIQECVGGASAPARAAAGTVAPADDAFVGREELLAALERAWAEAWAGRGGVALLVGEPGIGKSRAAQELAARAAATGACVALGRCSATEGAPAFWPWVQVLRALVPPERADALRTRLGPGAAEIAALVPALASPERVAAGGRAGGEPERFLLCDGVATLVTQLAEERPILLWLDDLHRADAPSLVLLRHLAAALARARVLVVATLRPADGRAQPELAATLGALARSDRCTRHGVEGFTEDEVVRFLAARGRADAPRRLVAQLHERTRGNPFFLHEAVGWLEQRALFAAAALGARLELRIPPAVRDVLAARLVELSPACRRVLAIAALLGSEFGAPLLARVAEVGREELLERLDEAAAAGLVEAPLEPCGRFAFRHELVREVAAGELPVGERARAHQRIGRALEALHAHDPEPPLADLSHHFHQAIAAGEEERALRWALRAAEQAHALLAWEQEALELERALHALEALGAPPERRLELLLRLAETRLLTGAVDTARDAALRAARAARALGDGAALVRAALGYGGLAAWGVPASPDRRALLEEALAVLGPAPTAERARVLARLVAERPDHDVLARVRPLAEEAVRIARAVGDPDCLAEALHAHHFVLQGPDHLAERGALAREVLALDCAPERRWALRENLAADALLRGDIEACRSELARAREQAEALRHPAFLWLGEGTRASLALLEGRLDAAERHAREALSLGQRTANPNAVALFLGHAHLLAREHGRSETLATTVAGQLPGVQWVGSYARAAFASLFLELGRGDEARAAFRALAGAGFAALPRRDDWLATLVELAWLCAALGERAHAPALEALLAPYAGWHAVYQGPLLYLGPVSRALAHLAALQGRRREALEGLAQAHAEAEAVQSPPWVARIERERAALRGR